MNLRTYLSAERGRLVKLARNIGAHASDVSAWANLMRPVPIIVCWSIERATTGAVTRKDLRPNDWHLIWPELGDESWNSAAES
ncbi:transcriptional regulator [Paraburkholderia pallida]|uniref:Cro/Cl family transcriptional regulator n=1 Tax=Paraburkholderia pallida TaxID=2547399 RepID=A0A4P7CVI1_9BURK|nr:YdaS family helix-turn-helix protein [Paraburkholderia pallida]QBQ98184.1 Cro/Cl family transcriptional regulator [Paraburkholderia pallida]